ncbi:tRNA (adenosine(37)-N6)-threonylcarbamoyltransferase complex dimerization subunit type 1 TsaB [Phycisphaerales bacterium AB-hyl4]|uniref:tRNA (Adenosine(37)-N6)-threonylcarbamoyltransferase complex dimerization subunit type 1 TsaB n=1 Tax=Natronomicrosphaera hydrolytica TaxID=3242702 RepID=A0ABV4U5Z5_9BACT
MRDGSTYNLAIETASRAGSLALGRGDALLATVDLPVQRRHRVGLLPGVATLCEAHGVTAEQLGEVYVSLGPGSFTGLRVAMASAVTLSVANASMRLVGVPTLDVLARNTPSEYASVAVCLNVKRGSAWCGVFVRHDDDWQATVEPGLRSMDELLAVSPRPTAVLGDPLPTLPDPLPTDVTVLPSELARPRAEAVWRLGRLLAQEGRYTASTALLPIYARPPEAVTLWDQRHRPTQASTGMNTKLETRN